MSQTYVAAPRARIRLAVAALIGAAILAAVVARPSRSPLPAPIGPEQLVCEPEPAPPPGPEPPPMPPPSAYDELAACLRSWRAAPEPGSIAPYLIAEQVSVDKIRHWVIIDGDPAYFYDGRWQFPLSGEGDAQMPSGLYGAVPGCGLSIVN